MKIESFVLHTPESKLRLNDDDDTSSASSISNISLRDDLDEIEQLPREQDDNEFSILEGMCKQLIQKKEQQDENRIQHYEKVYLSAYKRDAQSLIRKQRSLMKTKVKKMKKRVSRRAQEIRDTANEMKKSVESIRAQFDTNWNELQGNLNRLNALDKKLDSELHA